MNCLECATECNYTYCSLSCSNRSRTAKNKTKYDLNPKLCKECVGPIKYEARARSIFCSHSCAATHHNRPRILPKKLRVKLEVLKYMKDNEFLNGKIWKRDTLRKYLIKHYGNLCSVCSIPNIWNDKPLTLIVDHIDGDVSNNLPTNLRLLCPNCNSQTDTFCGRNRGKGRESRGFKRGR